MTAKQIEAINVEKIEVLALLLRYDVTRAACMDFPAAFQDLSVFALSYLTTTAPRRLMEAGLLKLEHIQLFDQQYLRNAYVGFENAGYLPLDAWVRRSVEASRLKMGEIVQLSGKELADCFGSAI